MDGSSSPPIRALIIWRDAAQVIDNSVRATRAFVKQYLSDTITRAQSSIASYGAQYSERMFAALTTCQQGACPPFRCVSLEFLQTFRQVVCWFRMEFAARDAGDDARKAALERSQSHLAVVNDLLVAVAGLQGRVQALMPADAAAGPSFEDAVDVETCASEALDPFALVGAGAGSGFFDASSLGGSVASLAAAAEPVSDAEAAKGPDLAGSSTSAVTLALPTAADAAALEDIAEAQPLRSVLITPTAQPAGEQQVADLEPAAAAVSAASAVPSAEVAGLRSAFSGAFSVLGSEGAAAEDAEAQAMAMAIELSLQQEPAHGAASASAVDTVANVPATAAPHDAGPTAAASAAPVESPLAETKAAEPAAEALPSRVPVVAVQHEVEDTDESEAEAASPASASSSTVMLPAHDDWTMVDDESQAVACPRALEQ